MTRLSISTAWDETADFVRREGGILFLIAFALTALPGAAWQFFLPAPAAGVPPSPWFLLGILPVLVLTTIGTLSITILAIGRETIVGAALARAGRRVWPLLAAFLLVSVAFGLLATPLAYLGIRNWPAGRGVILLGALAFLVLFVFVWIRLLMATPVAAAEDVGPLGILRRSWALTAGRFWKLLGFVLLVALVLIVLMLVVASVGGALVLLVLGAPDPGSLAKLVLLLLSSVVNAAIGMVFTTLIARIYVQLAAGGTTGT